MPEKLSEKEIEDFKADDIEQYPVMPLRIQFYFLNKLSLFISVAIEV